MIKNLNKHPKILADVLLKLKKNEIDGFVDAYTEILKQKGILLYYPRIVSETLKIISKEIQKNTIQIKYKNFMPEISAKFKKVFGSDVLIEESIDEDLISGLVINTYDKKIDGSIKGRLQVLKSNMTN